MFSNRWFSRAAASHWLSPSVSMPTSKCICGWTCAAPVSPVLVRVAQRHVPGGGALVERRIHCDPVHLRDELQRRLDLEVAGSLEDPPEARVHRESADLVGVGLAGLAIDPPKQCRQSLFVIRVSKKIYQQRDPAAWL